jgi:hypothetical protein
VTTTTRKSELLTAVTRHYLDSHDFNGLPVGPDILVEDVKELIEAGLLSLVRGDRHPNPHVKAFAAEPIEEQLQKIETGGLEGCLYPEPLHLQKVVDRSLYEGRPYSLCLALGEPQLSLKYFDLVVLEGYRNDPRYYFQLDDIHGVISIKDEHYLEGSESIVPQRDQALLQTFGFGYDKDMNRAVAVFLRYLHDLTPEHQRIWEARELRGEYFPHPDYWKSSMGEWSLNMPIFVAFMEELRIINEMAKAMGRKPLFARDFLDERPREFAFLLRPTRKAFNEFVHILDKMISENISKAFFATDISAEREEERADGKIAVYPKGTIQMLEEWIDQQVRFPDPGPKNRMIAIFRKVRKLRQYPAHAVKDDVFDQNIFKEQRQLVLDAYNAVRTLRLILANHPDTKTVEVPDWLQKGEISPY